MTFAAPIWFLLAAVLVLMAVGYVFAQVRTRKHTMRFANLELLESIAPQRPGPLRHLPIAVVIAGLSLLTVAAAGPTADSKVPRNRAVVMMAIDVSLSMEATDVTPSRLAAAQEAAHQFVDDMTPGINLGIISFAGTPAVLAAPSTDRAASHAAIDSLKLGERTATGEAMLLALQTIDVFSKTIGDTSADAGDQPIPARIVLMTDGKQTVGRPADDAARQAAAAKIPVSVIAFGTQSGSITMENGQVQEVPPDEPGMRRIAELSGGDFYTAATRDELKKVYTDLGEQIGYETQQKDVSRGWLLAGLIVVLVGVAGALAISRGIP